MKMIMLLVLLVVSILVCRVEWSSSLMGGQRRAPRFQPKRQQGQKQKQQEASAEIFHAVSRQVKAEVVVQQMIQLQRPQNDHQESAASTLVTELLLLRVDH